MSQFLKCTATLLVLFICTQVAVLAQISNCPRSQAEAYIDINNVRARILNTGGLFYRGEPHFYNIPKYSPSNAIFASGIWIMGMVDDELRGSGTRYGEWEFWAGPLDEEGYPPADCSAYDRLFKVSLRDLDEYDTNGIPTNDLRDWPWEIGAPVLDGDGDPNNYNLEGGDRPDIKGHQSIWWVMNDRGNVHESTELPPLGMEVHATAFAYASDSIASINNTTFYRYKLIYKGSSPMQDAYFGVFSDPDLGDFADDYVGSDTLLSLGYVYNSDNEDTGGEGYGTPPPAAGYSFLQGPLAPLLDQVDNDRDGTTDEIDERSMMSAFVYYNSGGGINEDPQYGQDYYYLMQGRWKDGRRILYGGDGFTGDVTNQPTPFMYSGDPATLEGWSERNPGIDGSLPPNHSGDRRFIHSLGPFSLEPGDTSEVVFAIVWAKGEDNWDSVAALKKATREVRTLFDQGIDISPPLSENLQPLQLAAPDNRIVQQPINTTLHWQNLNEYPHFEVELSENASFPDAIREEVIGTPSWRPPNLLPHTTYFWRARALNAGAYGPWSDTWQFTTSRSGSRTDTPPIQGFMTISNAAGFISPPDMAAFAFGGSGFPILEGTLTPPGSYPLADRPTPGVQQSTNNSVWGIHTGGDQRSNYFEHFLPRSIRRGWAAVGDDDYEWRFTQECLNKIDGVIEEGDCLAWLVFNEADPVEVPFELWNIGSPSDPGDDYRMIPLSIDLDFDSSTNFVFSIANDHAVSGGLDDPYTQWVYWVNPPGNNTTPGERGYTDFFFGDTPVQELRYSDLGDEVFGRMVLVQWNAGEAPPYEVELPEPGTTFRIVVDKLPAPVLSSPGDNRLSPLDQTTLYWQGTFPPFQLQIATDELFENNLINAFPLETTSYHVEHLNEGQSYFWRVRTVDSEGNGIGYWSATWQFELSSDPVSTALDAASFQQGFSLGINYPNPFRSHTWIQYRIPESAPVHLAVYDVLGRQVSVLVDAINTPGLYKVAWDPQHEPPGIYFYRLIAGTYSATRSMVLMR